ncbi:hypothetical protein JTB14_018821 [Gonioctena quinquepunctata]|nr:hypothetical protein JTB14_018821 [Gonioctena quinquepunctata]
MTQALMSILNVQNKKATTPGKRSRVDRKKENRKDKENKEVKGNKEGTKKTIEECSSSDSNVSVTLESEDDIFENGRVTAQNEISFDDEVEANDKENEMDADDEANDELLNSDQKKNSRRILRF